MIIKNNRKATAVVVQGCVVGVLDLTAAFIWAYVTSSTPPSAILRFIAAALIGPEAATTGSYEILLLGMFLHFAIALAWTGLYVLTYPFVIFFRKHPYASGLIYGILIWCVMNLCILPLTKVPPAGYKWKNVVIGASVLVVAVGVPLSLSVRRFYQRNSEIHI